MSDSGIEQQIGGVWKGVLSQFTGQGATREDVVETTLGTAYTILNTTFGELYPEDFTPEPGTWEENGRRQLAELVQDTRDTMEELGFDPPA